MALFGELMLCAAAVLSAAGFALCIAGRDVDRLFAAGRAVLLSAAGAGAAALAALAFLLVVQDYRVAYVHEYADETMSLGYLIAAVWGGQQGSLLLWAVLQTLFTAGFALSSAGRGPKSGRTALSILAALGSFFLLLVLFESDPFAPIGTEATRGIGLNPLLRNAYMVFHPPALFLGFVGFSVPLAHALGAFAEGDPGWLAAQRSWLLSAWIFLTIGNVLGMVWAYEELGWGGYWGWDPVENASLLPWLTGTALVHSALAEERLGAYRRGNVVLAALTFALIVFGTFLTRSGVIDSVHAFAGATVGPYLLGLIGAVIAVTAAVLLRGSPSRAEVHEPPRPSTRLSLVHANTWLLLAAAVFIAVATTMPLLSSVFRGDKVTLTPPFYDRWMVPIGLALLGLTGLCAAVGWSARGGARELLGRVKLPLGAGIAACAVAFAALGVRPELGPVMRFAPGLAVGLLVFTAAAVTGALRRAILAARRADRSPARGRRKLGAGMVHAAVVVLFIGFSGSGFTEESKGLVRPGEGLNVAQYELDFMGLRADRNVERDAVFADLDVRRDDEALGIMSPARFTYNSHPGRPTAEVSIARGLGEDLFLVLGETDEESGAAVIRAIVNPLVAWVWIGGALLVLGGVVAVLRRGWLVDLLEMRPETRRRLLPAAVALGTVACAVVASGAFLGAATAIAVAGGFALVFALVHLSSAVRAFAEKGGMR